MPPGWWRRHTTPSWKPRLARALQAAPPQRAFQNHCPIVPGGAGTTVTQMVPKEPHPGLRASWPHLCSQTQAGQQPEVRRWASCTGWVPAVISFSWPARPHPGGSATQNRQQEGFVPGLAETLSQTPELGGDLTYQGLGGSGRRWWGQAVVHCQHPPSVRKTGVGMAGRPATVSPKTCAVVL